MVIVGILCLLTVIEYYRLQQLHGNWLYISIVISMLMYVGLVVLVYQKGIAPPIEYAIYLGIVFLALLMLRLSLRKDPFSFTFQIVPATLYIALPLALLLAISQWGGHYRPGVILAILLFVWTNDIMAYIIGRSFGKRAFAPKISPKKTWEGTLGGWIACILLSLVIARFMPEFSQVQWLAMALVIALSGSAGDLVESLFKRKKGIKDSGVFLPGHGGFLDRLDSLLFCLPLVALLFLIWS